MTPLHPDKPLDRRRVALVYALALAALWLAVPRQIVDIDTLSRLSVEPTRGAVVGARP